MADQGMDYRFEIVVPVDQGETECVTMFFDMRDMKYYGDRPYWVSLPALIDLWRRYPDSTFVPFDESGVDGFIHEKFSINRSNLLAGVAIEAPKIRLSLDPPRYSSRLSFYARRFFRAPLSPRVHIGFVNGRHRTLALSDLGAPAIPVAMTAPSAELIERLIGGVNIIDLPHG